MAFNKVDLDNIKSKISLSGEFEKKSKLIKKGKDIWCCCPFHNEKTPSCKINDDLGSYYCFGCGAKGDIFTIYQDLFNYNFIDAVKELADRAGIKINLDNSFSNKEDKNILEILEISTKWFEENLKINENDCSKYLSKRLISTETINIFRLGYSYNKNTSLYKHLKNLSFNDEEILKSNVVKKDKNNKIKDFFFKRLIFPIVNPQGNVVGFGGRVLDNSNPKYINSPESNYFRKRFMLYNLNLAKDSARQKKNLLICEGYMDVISLYQNNIKSTVAPLGTSFTEEQLKLSWRYVDKPTIMFDSDEAGKRASYKSALMSLPLLNPNKFLQFIQLPKDTDPDNFIKNNSFEEFKKIIKQPVSLINYIFNESIKTVNLKDADSKIIFDKYLDDLISLIKDKKIRYFYKNELKNLFFKKLKSNPNKSFQIIKNQDLNQLKKKEILSFFSSLINHSDIRKEILDLLEKSLFLNIKEKGLVKLLKLPTHINKKYEELILDSDFNEYKIFIKKSQERPIFQLFSYSNPSSDPQKTLEVVKESIKNLNTRLSNLTKINKSLDEFENSNDSLTWDELQKIGQEILTNTYKE